MSIAYSVLSRHYYEHFEPLVNKFVRDVRPPNINRVPGLSLPLFRDGYESSALKLALIGQDDANTFVDLKGYFDESDPLETALKRFQAFEPNRKVVFWRFIMMFLASLHGRKQDWEKMKNGELSGILGSFAWSNVYPVAFYKSGAKKLGIGKDYWDSVRGTGERLFYGFRHIQETLHPNVVVIMCQNCSILTYIKKDYPDSLEEITEDVGEEVKREKLLTHYLLKLKKSRSI